MTRRDLAAVLVATLAVVGCGSNTNKLEPGADGGVGGGGGTGGGGSGGGGGGGGGGGTTIPPTAQLGTYIVLGDSISDRGGVGPYFYDELKTDLTAKYPNLMYVHAAVQGAITDEYSDNKPMHGTRPLLVTQIKGLANNYPGDILVTITIGGNDLVAHATEAISGGSLDAAVRAELTTHLDAELGELAMPGRLGSGKVYIILANIYDFSDGMGNFATLRCPPYANVNAMKDSTTFAAWNADMLTAVQKVQGSIYNMHDDFQGHGFNNKVADQVWYNTDCIHPNAKGHDEIRRAIYKLVTGTALP
jgi:lysophospholipase L1-like esterase